MKTRFKAYLPSKNKQSTSLTQTPKMVLTRKPDYMSPMQRQYKTKKIRKLQGQKNHNETRYLTRTGQFKTIMAQ